MKWRYWLGYRNHWNNRFNWKLPICDWLEIGLFWNKIFEMGLIWKTYKRPRSGQTNGQFFLEAIFENPLDSISGHIGLKRVGSKFGHLFEDLRFGAFRSGSTSLNKIRSCSSSWCIIIVDNAHDTGTVDNITTEITVDYFIIVLGVWKDAVDKNGNIWIQSGDIGTKSIICKGNVAIIT